MPHIITKKHDLLKTPSSQDGVFFDFVAHSPKEDKICVRVENKTFLLTKLEKNGKITHKTRDKHNRIVDEPHQ